MIAIWNSKSGFHSMLFIVERAIIQSKLIRAGKSSLLAHWYTKIYRMQECDKNRFNSVAGVAHKRFFIIITTNPPNIDPSKNVFTSCTTSNRGLSFVGVWSKKSNCWRRYTQKHSLYMPYINITAKGHIPVRTDPSENDFLLA